MVYIQYHGIHRGLNRDIFRGIYIFPGTNSGFVAVFPPSYSSTYSARSLSCCLAGKYNKLKRGNCSSILLWDRKFPSVYTSQRPWPPCGTYRNSMQPVPGGGAVHSTSTPALGWRYECVTIYSHSSANCVSPLFMCCTKQNNFTIKVLKFMCMKENKTCTAP